jgi:hypothetical protein
MTTVTFSIVSNPRNRSRAIVDEICNRGINVADVRGIHTHCVEPNCPIGEWIDTNRVYDVTVSIRETPVIDL